MAPSNSNPLGWVVSQQQFDMADPFQALENGSTHPGGNLASVTGAIHFRQGFHYIQPALWNSHHHQGSQWAPHINGVRRVLQQYQCLQWLPTPIGGHQILQRQWLSSTSENIAVKMGYFYAKLNMADPIQAFLGIGSTHLQENH